MYDVFVFCVCLPGTALAPPRYLLSMLALGNLLRLLLQLLNRLVTRMLVGGNL